MMRGNCTMSLLLQRSVSRPAGADGSAATATACTSNRKAPLLIGYCTPKTSWRGFLCCAAQAVAGPLQARARRAATAGRQSSSCSACAPSSPAERSPASYESMSGCTISAAGRNSAAYWRQRPTALP